MAQAWMQWRKQCSHRARSGPGPMAFEKCSCCISRLPPALRRRRAFLPAALGGTICNRTGFHHTGRLWRVAPRQPFRSHPSTEQSHLCLQGVPAPRGGRLPL